MVLIEEAKALYKETFREEPESVYYSHGRAEIIGNHTDHQGGIALIAGVDLGITAAIKGNVDEAVRVISSGFAPFMFFMDELEPCEEEKGTTIALFKGVFRYFKEHGFKVGGFSAALRSDLPAGSGLSSSAALEGLVAEVLNALYNNGEISALDRSLAGQYAEQVFFGKPCGLLDQLAVNTGGLNLVDFKPDPVEIKPVPWIRQIKILLINTGSSHQDLTEAYASIPADMKSVAKNLLGVERLGDSDMETFLDKVGMPCEGVSEEAKLRAQHFFDECKRVEDAARALGEGDSLTFFNAISLSQQSSLSYLHNTFLPGQYDHSPQQACDLVKPMLTKGACRMSGGGFAGSVLLFVFEDQVEPLIQALAPYYGKEAVVPLTIADGGPRRVA